LLAVVDAEVTVDAERVASLSLQTKGIVMDNIKLLTINWSCLKVASSSDKYYSWLMYGHAIIKNLNHFS